MCMYLTKGCWPHSLELPWAAELIVETPRCGDGGGQGRRGRICPLSPQG